jgi:hypothetical protein
MIVVFANYELAQTPAYGAATPQEAVAGVQKATQAGSLAGALPFISPSGRQLLATSLIQPMLMWVRFSNPDDPMPGSKPLAKPELDAKRKSYRAVLDGMTRTLKPHGLDSLIGKAPMAPEVQQTLDAAVRKTDTVVLTTAILASLKTLGPLMDMPATAIPSPPVMGSVSGYKISGDRATAKEGAGTIDFERIQGRWYLAPPPAK